MLAFKMFSAHSMSFKRLGPVLASKLLAHQFRRRILGVPCKRRLFQNTSRTSTLTEEGGEKCSCDRDPQLCSPLYLARLPPPKFGSVEYLKFRRVFNIARLGNYEGGQKGSSWRIVSRGLSSTTSVNLDKELERSQIDGPAAQPPNGRAKNSNGNGTEVKPRRTLDQVVYHLQADLRRKRRIHKAEIHNAVELVEEASRVGDFGPFLIECCSDVLPDFHPTSRVSLAQRIWSVIQKSKEYSVGPFEAMLKTLALNEDKTADPFSFLDEARENGIKVSGTMYFFALLIVCQRGDIESAVKILTKMKEDDVSVNERFFNVVIIGNARRGDLKGAAEILEIMRASHIKPSGQTWTSLLQVYIEAEDEQLVRKTFSEIAGVRLKEEQFYELLRAAGRQSKRAILDFVIEQALESKNTHYLSIMNVCYQLMHGGNCQNALHLVLKFRVALSAKDGEFGEFFINELHATNVDSETYLSLIMSLQGDNRNPYALNMAAESCLRHKKPNLAFAVYEGMSVMGIPVRPHYFVPPFLLELEHNGIMGAIQVLKRMQALDVQPDWEMLLNWIIPRIFDVEDNIMEVLQIVQENTGISYSSGLLSAGLAETIRRGNLDAALKIVDALKGKLIHADVIMQRLFVYFTAVKDEESFIKQTFENDISMILKILKYVTENIPTSDNIDYVGQFILKLIESERTKEANAILMGANNEIDISISEAVATIIKEKMMDAGNVNVSPQLQYFKGGINAKHKIHPDKMDVIGLECHIEELEAKELNARGTYRKLFLKYCQAGDLQKAVEIKETFEREFGNISSGMKSALMGNYIQNKVLKPAMELYEDLSKSANGDDTVELDTYKLIDLATLQIENGFLEDGIKLVENECLTRTHDRPETFQRNVVRLLKTISVSQSSSNLEKKSVDNVFRLTELFLSNGFIIPNNPTLAPSIKDLIIRDQLEDAVLRMEMYSKKYKLAPCLQELTYATLNNPPLLDRVTKCSAATRGLRESKRLLALAKSDVGDLDGAAAIFRELAGQLSFISLIKQCEYLATKRETDKLLNLITSLYKTGRNYDCKKLYDIAAKSCQRCGDPDGLKKVILNMEENDQFVSPALKEFVGQTIR